MKGDLHTKTFGLIVVVLLILLVVGVALKREQEPDPIGATLPTPVPQLGGYLDLGLGGSEDVMADIPPLEEMTDEERAELAKLLAGYRTPKTEVWKRTGRQELGKAIDKMSDGKWVEARKHLDAAHTWFELLDEDELKEEKQIVSEIREALQHNEAAERSESTSVTPTPTIGSLDLGLGPEANRLMEEIPPLEVVTDEERAQEARQLAESRRVFSTPYGDLARQYLNKTIDLMESGEVEKAREMFLLAEQCFQSVPNLDEVERKAIERIRESLY